MTKYKYFYVTAESPTEFQEVLNKYGEKGWKLVNHTIVFKGNTNRGFGSDNVNQNPIFTMVFMKEE